MKVIRTIDDWVQVPVIGLVIRKMAGIFHIITVFWRRSNWFLENLNSAKWKNMTIALFQFATKRKKMNAFPLAVKIDISPLCNLSCTVCVHALPSSNLSVASQSFNARQKMNVADYVMLENRSYNKILQGGFFRFLPAK